MISVMHFQGSTIAQFNSNFILYKIHDNAQSQEIQDIAETHFGSIPRALLMW